MPPSGPRTPSPTGRHPVRTLNCGLPAASVRLSERRWIARLEDPGLIPTLTLGGRHRVEPGWSTGERRLPHHLLYFVLDREVEGHVGGRPHRLSAGSFLWIPPGIPHELHMPGRGKPFTTYFFRARFRSKKTGPDEGFIKPLVIHHAWNLEAYLAQLLMEWQNPAPHGPPRLRHLFALLFLSGRDQETRARPRGNVLDGRQKNLLQAWLSERWAQRPNPAELAAVVQLSPDYFTRVFRNTYGASPKSFLVRERLRVAATRLLESPQPVHRLAAQFGYEDLFLFSRQFKKVLGMSPTRWARTRQP